MTEADVLAIAQFLAGLLIVLLLVPVAVLGIFERDADD